jgi:hypothetical protein
MSHFVPGWIWIVAAATLTNGVFAQHPRTPDPANAKPISLADERLEPDLENPLRTIDSDGVTIIIYAAKASEHPVRLSERDQTVFSAGSGDAPYYYPQNPTPTAIELRAESNYYDLTKSETLAIQVTGLQPNTVYFYRVADSVEVNRFKTPPMPGEFVPFRFAVIGDTQGPYDHPGYENINKDRLVMAPFAEANLPANAQFNRITESIRSSNVKPDFVAHVGDIVEDGRYWVQWTREQFSDLKYLLTMAPVYPIMGNHEYHDPRFHRYFSLPITDEDHAADPERPFFSYDWGDAHFIFLDMNGGWYTIYDIDAVPTESGPSYDINGMLHEYDIKQVRGGSSYTIRDEALNRLNGHLATDQIARLQPLKGKEMNRATLQQQLRDMGFNKDEDRKIRTAAITCDRSNVANCRVILAIYGSPVQEAQIKWVKKDLEANKDKKYIFAFTHHPQLYGTSENKQFIELYEQYRVSATFSGHLHLYSHHYRNRVHYFQSGGGSDETYTALVDDQADSFVVHRFGAQYMILDVQTDRAVALGVGPDNLVFEKTVILPRDTAVETVPATEMPATARTWRVYDPPDSVPDRSNWQTDDGVVTELSNLYSPPREEHKNLWGSQQERIGTMRIFEPGADHADGELSLEIASADIDTIGVTFRLQDNDRYYVWAMDGAGWHALACKDRDNYRVLASNRKGYETDRWYQLKIVLEGPKISVYVDGEKDLEATDPTFDTGTFALYAWGSAGAKFRNVKWEGTEQ